MNPATAIPIDSATVTAAKAKFCLAGGTSFTMRKNVLT